MRIVVLLQTLGFAALFGLAGCAPAALTEGDLAAVAHPPAQVQAEVAQLLPVAMRELDPIEAHILAAGRPLTPVEMGFARRAGVAHPEKVRVLAWPQAFRPPEDKAFAKVYHPQGAFAITFGYGIALRKEAPWVLAHELVHVGQYERLGGREAFTRAYLTQTLVLKTYAIPLEREAFKRGNQISPVPQGATRRWIETLQ
ncbi:hypothetical protein [Thioclava sp. GXIMD4216]|uniref:DUF4157 domain-containing protein n=1 Tax=Thioclava litoralis TaxID=3076557 RepID=A0ABZ1DW76_9RHOB|nr:hypothetical protein RPE78_09965 [Thioclava sp. FTW29]